MKVRSNEYTKQLPPQIIEEMNYVMEDVKSYDDLTPAEKRIWSLEDFNKYFEQS